VNDEHPPSPGWSVLKRFLLAGVVIVALSAGATATVALNTVSGIAEEVFPKINQINAPKSVVTPVYSGGPQTFMVLGTDRRTGFAESDRLNPPRSDTMLLVHLDPGRGQTSIMSIPRDLMVNIRTPKGQLYANEKINAAYTIGSQLKGSDGGIVLAAETIEREVFPELKGHLNGIIDVNFTGFIKVVDALGCVFVNVDHRYIGGGALGENFSAINLQPGYQKLCYNSALSYVRFRHFDSDFVRVARQQDFIRNLREQISPSDVLGKIEQVATVVGRAIRSNFKPTLGTFKELAKLIAFSQGKPLRQVKFRTTEVNAQFGGGSYVTSNAALEKATLNDFLHGHEKVRIASSGAPKHTSKQKHRSSPSSSSSAAALGLIATSGESEAVKAALSVPIKVLYPTLQTAAASQETVRPYYLRNQQGKLHHAYVVVFKQNTLGGYYDFEGSDWLNPPLFAHARKETIGGKHYLLVDDGSHIHVLGWRSGKVLYWVNNTLLEDLSNAQMLAIAKSAQMLH
jgi:LCP family protein required for cell wall assembly